MEKKRLFVTDAAKAWRERQQWNTVFAAAFQDFPRRTVREIHQQEIIHGQEKGEIRFKNHNFDQEKPREYLARMIISHHERPLTMVEHSGFHQFSTSLQPLFKDPSKNTVKTEILKIQKVKNLIKFIGGYSRSGIALNADTSSNQGKGFMAVRHILLMKTGVQYPNHELKSKWR